MLIPVCLKSLFFTHAHAPEILTSQMTFPGKVLN